MKFVQVTKVKNLDSEKYDQIVQSWAGDSLTDGEIFRVAGKGKDVWFVIDGWETREQCDASGAKLMPVLQKEGVAMDSMELEEFEIHDWKVR